MLSWLGSNALPLKTKYQNPYWIKETQQDVAKTQLRAVQFLSHYSKDLFMFSATFVSNFTASRHCGNIFVDDNKSVVLSVRLSVYLPPICSSCCDVLRGAPSFHPQPRSAGSSSSSSMMWDWVWSFQLSHYVEATGHVQKINLLLFLEKCQSRGRGVRCLPQCVQLDWISAMLVGVQQQNHTMIWLFLAAGFRIPVLLSSLQRNALWHLFGAGLGLFVCWKKNMF